LLCDNKKGQKFSFVWLFKAMNSIQQTLYGDFLPMGKHFKSISKQLSKDWTNVVIYSWI